MTLPGARDYHIEQRGSDAGSAIGIIAVIVGAAFASSVPIFDPGKSPVGFMGLMVGAAFLVIFPLYSMIMTRRKWQERQLSFARVVASLGASATAIAKPDAKESAISLKMLPEDEFHFERAVRTPAWTYYDFVYDLYAHTKYGRQKVGAGYYAVMSILLPRELPNILFDAAAARHRQFRWLIDSSQQLSFEGDFDKHFTAYAPDGYHVDTLSFITPEVMEVMVQYAQYDMEIAGDRLYLYDALEYPETQIPAMAAAGEAITKKLLNNILTYRDERLDGMTNRQSIAVAGQTLNRSLAPYLIAAAIVIVSAIIFVIIAIVSPE